MPNNPLAVPALYSTPRLTTLIASLIVALAAGTNYVSWCQVDVCN